MSDEGNELVCLRTFNERTQAELVKAYLQAHGIEVIVRADDAGGMIPSITMSASRPCILVRVKDAAEAQRLLKDAEDKLGKEEEDL
jgi:hypothetical protein